ncbi:FadR/GntR family transcriptional regulator [Halomonas sp. HP20-15]|uniref:FadR/GntR family transcriptional regulator n=1 Tax=Halomonas sp. HP20-15 TaxID=3085901 RepID=UPI0029811602|nr:FadR/GntR family transcriptional regulator [Halomonas sp. HP20-15]MDW5377563.1 FadR/GntR family transcriptional regulator [Halomonas sp. HP20-15]
MAGKPPALDNLAPLNVRQVPRKGSLSLHVADQLEALISAGSIPVGQKLPGENGLCDSFGISRTVIREAIAHLKSRGLVTTRRGVGTRVVRRTALDPMPAERIHPTTVEDILHVLELRMAIEPAVAALAATRHASEDRRRLQVTHASFIDACNEGSQAREEDYAFHRAIAEATGNPCFTMFYEQLRHCVIPRANLIDDEINPAATGKYLSRVEGEHTDIIEAILARDPQAAHERMHQHLNRARIMYAKFQNA